MMRSNKQALLWANIGIFILAALVVFILITSQPQAQTGISLNIFDASQQTNASQEWDELNSETLDEDNVQETERTEVALDGASKEITSQGTVKPREDGTDTRTE